MTEYSSDIYGAIEAGGTKFICALGTAQGEIVRKTRIPTEDPSSTILECIKFFEDSKANIKGLGICSFGPVDLNPQSKTYGYITKTPKAAWENTNLCGLISEGLRAEIPIAFDTDVNGSAYGEYIWGAGKGLENIVYVTIGTGIGGGAIVDGKPLHGLMHPEMGHISIKRHEKDDFAGNCRFHGDCLEGLANGPSLISRWGSEEEFANNPLALEIEAFYIAQAAFNYLCTLSPQRVILGGGVMNQERLLPLVRAELEKQIAGYICLETLNVKIDDFVVLPKTGPDAGILGALALAANLRK